MSFLIPEYLYFISNNEEKFSKTVFKYEKHTMQATEKAYNDVDFSFMITIQVK